MKSKKIIHETPHTEAFRAWLSSAISLTGLSPARLGLAVGASINFVGSFLRDPSRDITLSRAAKLEQHLRTEAMRQGKTLPAIRCRLSVRGVA